MGFHYFKVFGKQSGEKSINKPKHVQGMYADTQLKKLVLLECLGKSIDLNHHSTRSHSCHFMCLMQPSFSVLENHRWFPHWKIRIHQLVYLAANWYYVAVTCSVGEWVPTWSISKVISCLYCMEMHCLPVYYLPVLLEWLMTYFLPQNSAKSFKSSWGKSSIFKIWKLNQ